MPIASFFNRDQFVIDQKVAVFANAYRVYDVSGEQIGTIEQDFSVGRGILGIFLGRQNLGFKVRVKDVEGRVLATIRRGATLMLSKIVVADSQGVAIAGINQKWTAVKPRFDILGPSGNQIATITGDWKGWNFQIAAEDGRTLGAINKRWSGVMKELFTTADKYLVSIDPSVAEDAHKVAIVASAITIDMVLKNTA